MSSYFPDDASEGDGDSCDIEQQRLVHEEMTDDRTPLDKTIDRIGMGSYQWTLLSLCGFGWMADNMWIQAIAIILPRVQQHYSVPDNYIGIVSSSMFAGMMFGAVGWGTCSDLMGRSAAFNATLFFTAFFGMFASFTTSFTSLCILLFFLGSAVGGSMPTDGTLLLEHMPKGKQYLVTALSVFFSFGAVLSAVVALLVVPQHSCVSRLGAPCDMDQNMGWKYMLMSLGVITLSMFIARILFFRLHESPRYLVHAGRPQEAVESLQLISRFNGSELEINLEDVKDCRLGGNGATPAASTESTAIPAHHEDLVQREVPYVVTVFDADVEPTPNRLTPPGNVTQDYHAVGESSNQLDSHVFATPTVDHPPASIRCPANILTPSMDGNKDVESLIPQSLSRTRSRSPSPPSQAPLSASVPDLRPPPRRILSRYRSFVTSRRLTRSSSFYEKGKTEAFRKLPRWIRRPLIAWLDRVAMVLSPEWARTTLLVWAVWCSMSLAYTMFNVFLPKLLETRSGSEAKLLEEEKTKSLEESLWDVVIFTIGGCPGAILGAYMVESPLGRRGSLASSTFVTAFFCVVFALVESPFAVRASTVGISLSATTMWAVLYGWTPEIFGTKVRGTACGIASALSRIGGMIAPLLGGTLLVISRSVPVYTSVVIFAFAGICVLLLNDDVGDGGKGDSERVIVH